MRTAVAQKLDTPVDLTLPGQTEAFDVANLYPRATGYIAERRVDIGSRVHTGRPAGAHRSSRPRPAACAGPGTAWSEPGGSAASAGPGAIGSGERQTGGHHQIPSNHPRQIRVGKPEQNADNATANASVQTAGIANAEAGVAVALANLKAQPASVDRLQALTAFEQVKAPFDGMITARNVDTGDLLTQDSLGRRSRCSVSSAMTCCASS